MSVTVVPQGLKMPPYSPIRIYFYVREADLRYFDPSAPGPATYPSFSDTHKLLMALGEPMRRLIGRLGEAVFGADFHNRAEYPHQWSLVGHHPWMGVSVSYSHNISGTEPDPDTLNFTVTRGSRAGELRLTFTELPEARRQELNQRHAKTCAEGERRAAELGWTYD